MAVEYEYKCPECGHTQLTSTKDGVVALLCKGEDAPEPHPVTALRRVYNLGGISFKGSGFYKNDKWYMDKIYQTVFQDEENTGNCLQACIASLFELPLEQVPHFAAMGDYWMQQFIKWGLSYGFLVLSLDGYPPPEIQTIMGGPSPRGDFTHAVVVGLNNEIIHDPHPSGDGLAPGDRWYYLFVPIKPLALRDMYGKKEELV